MNPDRLRITTAVAVAAVLASIWFLRDVEPSPWSDAEILLLQSLWLENLPELPPDPTNAVADNPQSVVRDP